MAARGFSINTRAIAQMTAEIQREFDRHPVHVPVEGAAQPATPAVYNAPVVIVNGDGAQIAWGNQDVTQTHAQTIAAGYEPLAQAIVSTVAGLEAVPLEDAERDLARTVANEALNEISKTEPNRTAIHRAVSALKDVLVPLVVGAGTSAANVAATEWAKTAIEQLSGTAPQ